MVSRKLRVAMAQLNFMVGDIDGNSSSIIASAEQARDKHYADIIVFSELSLTGYSPEDLLLRPSMQLRVSDALQRIKERVYGIHIIFGYPWVENNKRYNACVVIANGNIVARYYKRDLPNYQVFDEKRYFTAGDIPCVFTVNGARIALMICEDLWSLHQIKQAGHAGAEIIIGLNASPFHVGKQQERENMLVSHALEGNLSIIYVNQVGGQDELVFDGGSCVVDHNGLVCMRACANKEALQIVDFSDIDSGHLLPSPSSLCAIPSDNASIYQMLVLGLKDYVYKNGFKSVVLGLSGGVDSALTLAIAVDALGADFVYAVMMPYHYTAEISLEDAHAQASMLGVDYTVLPIVSTVESFLQILQPIFCGLKADTTEENLQARCRGVLLMAIANKQGHLLLTTGNKSEMAVGYATLYGDMAGGFSVLKDVSKTRVFELCEYRNTLGQVIPQRVITRAPSAELAPGQLDENSLPPYSILDQIISNYVEKDCSAQSLIKMGFSEEIVNKVIRLIDINEHKRRQSVIGVRITQRSFGRERRYPITSGWSLGL